MNADLLSLLVMLSVALSCGCAVALGEYLWTRLKAGDDPLSDRPYGDWPFVPTENLKARHHAQGDTL